MVSLSTWGGNSDEVSFQNITNEWLIREAYERIEVVMDDASGVDALTALRSMNFILTDWMNYGIRQWMVRSIMVPVVVGQSVYPVTDIKGNPVLSDIQEMSLRIQQRLTQLLNAPSLNLPANGVSFDSEGSLTSDNAFDGNTSTSCTQVNPDGFIGWNFNGGLNLGNTQQYSGMTLVGIQVNPNTLLTDTRYTIVVETSSDGVTWSTIAQFPKIPYPAGKIVWQQAPQSISLQYIRIRETGGLILDIAELYFSEITQDILMTNISRSEYMSLPQKTTTNGLPNQYFLDRQITPQLYIWPFPTTNVGVVNPLVQPPYMNTYILLIEYKGALLDAGSLFNTPEIPSRFYEAMVSQLAVRLAIKKGKADKIDLLRDLAATAWNSARAEDTERVPMRFYTDPFNNGSGWSY
jgi:hypothetical protein